MQTIFEEYGQLDAQIAALEAKKDQLKPMIIQKMVEEGMNKVDTSVGKFSITKLKKWDYPEWVIQKGEDFKEAKAKAESTGDATYEEKDSLRFSIVKL